MCALAPAGRPPPGGCWCWSPWRDDWTLRNSSAPAWKHLGIQSQSAPMFCGCQARPPDLTMTTDKLASHRIASHRSQLSYTPINIQQPLRRCPVKRGHAVAVPAPPVQSSTHARMEETTCQICTRPRPGGTSLSLAMNAIHASPSSMGESVMMACTFRGRLPDWQHLRAAIMADLVPGSVIVMEHRQSIMADLLSVVVASLAGCIRKQGGRPWGVGC